MGFRLVPIGDLERRSDRCFALFYRIW